MNTPCGTTRVPAVAVLMASLLLAACDPGPAPAEEASAPLAEAVVTLQSGSTAASAIPSRAARVPPPIARASEVAPGGSCPSAAAEPAPIDGGREVTQAPEPDAAVQDAAPAPVQPEASRP